MITKKKITALCLPIVLLFLGYSSSAQTFFHGGIYTNTTWTMAGSPYVLYDTVVVFPGVTLTIQPGVVVEFDSSAWIEVRQSSIIANGTPALPITFTSADSAAPFIGEAGGVWLNGSDTGPFEYCLFEYNTNAILSYAYLETVTHCYFNSNSVGLELPQFLNITYCGFTKNSTALSGVGGVNLDYCNISSNIIGIQQITGSTVEHCQISGNSNFGIQLIDGDTLRNDQITNNGTGIIGGGQPSWIFLNNISYNNVGIELSNDSIFCNSICSNFSYDILNENMFGYNRSVADNYWCTTDSTLIRPNIYDGYINTSLGLVFFKPFDTLVCSCNLSLSIKGPQGICTGNSATLTSYVTDPYYSSLTYLWEPGGSTNSTITVSPDTTTTYTLVVQDAAKCTVKDSITIHVDTTPIVGISGLPGKYCMNGAPITLTGTPPGGAFSGNGVSPTGYFNPAKAGAGNDIITYSFTSIHGCSDSASDVVSIIGPPDAPTICYASADSSVNHDIVFWSRLGLDTNNIDSFIIYRQVTTDSFGQVGHVSKFDSVFIDTGTNPLVESYFYELAIKDTCGQLSPVSLAHQTILLQSSLGVGGVVNLSWNFYYGNSVNYYKIYRYSGTGPWVLLDSVPGTINSFTDLTPPASPGLKYMVSTNWDIACSPNSSYSRKPIKAHGNGNLVTNNSTTYSNSVTGFAQVLASSQIEIYPNPAKDMLYIIFNGPVDGIISMNDVVGKELFNAKVTGGSGTKIEIPVSELQDGVYLLQIKSNNGTVIKKIVKM